MSFARQDDTHTKLFKSVGLRVEERKSKRVSDLQREQRITLPLYLESGWVFRDVCFDRIRWIHACDPCEGITPLQNHFLHARHWRREFGSVQWQYAHDGTFGVFSITSSLMNEKKFVTITSRKMNATRKCLLFWVSRYSNCGIPWLRNNVIGVNTVMSDDLVQGALDEIVKCECEYVSLLEKYESLLEYVD